MGRLTGYIVAVATLVLVVGGAADISTRTFTCMTCHTEQAVYARWMATKLKAEKKGFSHELISCAQCHIKGAAAGTVMSRFRGLYHAITYLVPQIDPRRPIEPELFARVRLPSENCRHCHFASVRRKAVYRRDLPAGLKKIGLAMDHHKHVLTRDKTCARCHERYKGETAGPPDKTVNYAEVNHLACDACHVYSSHAYRSGRPLAMTPDQFDRATRDAWGKLSTNPRWMVAFPTKESCQRCHNGKIHYKTVIFRADCTRGNNFDNCVKCHPLMSRKDFEKHRRESNSLTTASRNAAAGG